jgi:hypothetical protein
MAIVHVKLIKKWNGYKTGSVCPVRQSVADKLVKEKVAKFYISKDPEKLKTLNNN